LGRSLKRSAFGDRSQKSLLIAIAAACDLTLLISQKIWFSASFSSFRDGRGEALAAIHGRGLRLMPEC